MTQTKQTAGGQPPVTGERIMQMAFGYAPPLIMEAAVHLHVFDLLADKPHSVEELAQASGASTRGLRILLNALVGLELLRKEGGRYALTPESETFLVSSKKSFLGGLIRHTSQQLIPKWLQLTDVVRTGEPGRAVNEQGDGAAFFQQFVEDLFPMNYGAARALGEELKVADAKEPLSVLDLAAGSGVWSVALAEMSPQVRVTAVDWADVLTVTRKVVARHGLEDRFRLVAGDLQEADFGTGHRVATLGHILHSEGAKRSRALLAKTHAALAPGGTIAIAEWLVSPDRTQPANGLIFAVNMLVNTREGDTFSFEEISAWLREAGFVNPRKLPVPGPSPLVLADRPGG